MNKVAVIVVTYNRRQKLADCIGSLLAQTADCDIILVDNASTDGTRAYLDELGYSNHQRIRYLGLQENLGGSGGFYHGLEYAMGGSWQWFWLMDDDALPEKNALQGLLKQKLSPHNVYGSAAIGIDSEKKQLCFPVRTLKHGKEQFVEYHHLLNDMEKVVWLPFLGFFINRAVVAKIGLPDKDFFILDDDVEYSERAKEYGSDILMVKNSIIHHPIQRPALFYFLGIKIYYRSMPPWKIYYDVRNKILIAKRYYPVALWTKTLPGIIFRAVFSIFHESEKLRPLKAYLAAIRDGLLNNTGKTMLPPESG
jgi:rhamnopyranosyl-N-acetylglucosaminyl-diphospho-decaprenol beta-1,3/1,4-galactofuranosyltransferase